MTSAGSELIAQQDIEIGVGAPGLAETKKWIRQQVPYANYAGHSGALDEQVRQFCQQVKASFQNRMIAVHQRWAFNWATANGEGQTQEHEDDVCMPETQKMLAGKVARMAESLFDIDPFFEVEGVRDDIGSMQAYVTGAYIRRMLELGNYRDYVEPGAADGQLCNYSAIKVVWDRRFADLIHRKVELRGELGKPSYWHDERWMQRNALVTDAPKFELVDPFWLIVDIDAGHYDDLAYIGEESEQFLHSLEEKAKIGIFSQQALKELKLGRNPTENVTRDASGANVVDQFRQARSVTLPTGVMDSNPSGMHPGAKRIRCLELWAWYDFGDGIAGVVDPLGRQITGTQRVVITIAGGQVLQFRLNPFDKKFLPYALAVYNRNGHEMVASAPFDQVVVMNAQYDRYMSNVHRHGDLSVAPIIATGDSSDMGSSGPLSQVMPGTILNNPGDFQQVEIKDLPQSVEFFVGHFRREMEELSGHMRIYEQPQGTATEVERKVQEQQRTVRSHIRVLAAQWKQVALIVYKMAGQFATQAQKFAVVGKAASVLGKTFSMPPQWLQEDVDFRFVGLDSLHTYGTRSAGLAQWMNQWGAFLPQMPELNLKGLARLDFEYRVGKHAMNQVFPDTEPAWMKWSQQEENVMLMSGQPVPISRHDDDLKHAAEVAALIAKLRKEPGSPQAALDAAVEHLGLHVQAHQAKAEEQAAQQAEMERQAQLLGPGGGTPGVDKPAAGGGMEAKSKLNKTEGVTPGPAQSRTVARTGREGSGMSQTQQMSQ